MLDLLILNIYSSNSSRKIHLKQSEFLRFSGQEESEVTKTVYFKQA
jgi:hypothetical protein